MLGVRCCVAWVGSVRLIVSGLRTAAGELLVGGMANVCSHPDHRGEGAAKACMRAAQQVIASTADRTLKLSFAELAIANRL